MSNLTWEGAYSEAFIQNTVVNYKNVLIRCHKRKVTLCNANFVVIARKPNVQASNSVKGFQEAV